MNTTKSALTFDTQDALTTTSYQIQLSDGTWSPAIPETDIINYFRTDAGGITTNPETRLREMRSGHEFVVQEHTLLAALLRAFAEERPPGSTQTVSAPETDSPAQLSQPIGSFEPRMRGCPNCKRMVSTQAATQCPACGYLFRPRFDDTKSSAHPLSEQSKQAEAACRKTRGTSGARIQPAQSYGSGNGVLGTPNAEPSTASREMDVSDAFDPYAGLGDRDALVLREFARQQSQFMWWAIIGLLLSPTLFSVLLTLYAISRMHAIHQNVAGLGVDPGLWNAHEGRRFWKANRPSLILWSFVVLCVIAAGTFLASDIANSTARSPLISPDSSRAGLSAGS